LLDIHLPDKSGLELLKLLKQRYPELDIVMLTNHTSGNYRETCERFGASHFLDKSSEFETIPSVIEVYMQKLKKKSDFMPV
jgi:DNA-binding NarL/FixJ family response regulator